jgi:hypothetical protein
MADMFDGRMNSSGFSMLRPPLGSSGGPRDVFLLTLRIHLRPDHGSQTTETPEASSEELSKELLMSEFGWVEW